jgi:regulator of CtrA degradation|tara:strand:- start:233 stop:694 length:462 start_codon:yes stop_codon:yes gene_type:complete
MSSQHCLFPFIEKANQETIDLLLEARSYAQTIRKQGPNAPPPSRQLLINSEVMRMILRLASVMAWIMERKAAPPPSDRPRKDGKKEQALSDNALCMDANGSDDARLPLELRALLRNSHRLYVRVSRLDNMMRKGPDKIDPREIGEFTAPLVGH